MADDPLIRELREADAPAVARLEIAINPHQVVTAETMWQQASRRIKREQRRTWVAELGGEIAGYGWAGFEWAVPTPGKGRFWIGVFPELRRRGVGGALYERIAQHMKELGAWRMRTWVDADPDGSEFLERQGFRKYTVDVVSELRVAEAELPEPRAPVVPLAEALDRVRDLYEICAAGEIDMPHDEPETEISFADWEADDFGSPALSYDGSFVALADGRVVSLAFLTVDPERRLAYNQMTATLPGFRRRGLALAVKLASARWAAANGFERIVTENDADNAGMLAVNRRLGYRHLYDQVRWLLQWERPPVERG